jgi:hypothetical protein
MEGRKINNILESIPVEELSGDIDAVMSELIEFRDTAKPIAPDTLDYMIYLLSKYAPLDDRLGD